MAQNLERAAHRTSEIANMRMDEKHRWQKCTLGRTRPGLDFRPACFGLWRD
jgi:hypothetical protein